MTLFGSFWGRLFSFRRMKGGFVNTNTEARRCPNCRAVRPATNDPCNNCSWMPLQETELLFVDDEITCSECKQKRPATQLNCPNCGTSVELKSLTTGNFNFQISGIFIVMTVIAVCAAVGRFAPPLGIGMFLLSALAGVRTVILVQERKRHRYPAGSTDLMRFFGGSIGGIIIAGIVYGTTQVGVFFLLGVLVFPFMMYRDMNGYFMLGFTMLFAHAGAIYMLKQRVKDGDWKVAYIGGGFAFVSAVAIFMGSMVFSFRQFYFLQELFACIPVGIAFVATIVCSAFRGGALRAMLFYTGFSSAAIVFTAIGFLCDWQNPLYAGLGSASVTLCPVLLTILSLGAFWSWDDAFPFAMSNHRYRSEPSDSNRSEIASPESTRVSASVDANDQLPSDDGIEFQ